MVVVVVVVVVVVAVFAIRTSIYSCMGKFSKGVLSRSVKRRRRRMRIEGNCHRGCEAKQAWILLPAIEE